MVHSIKTTLLCVSRLLLAVVLLQFVAKPVCVVGQTHGIDVSHHQGNINWKKVAANKNIQFVYIKATEGSSLKDSHYKQNIKAARAAGLKVGSYHVYSGRTTAYEQFANFKSEVKVSQQDLIPVLDIEAVHCGKLYMKRVDKLLELMENHYGKKPMIYTTARVYYTHFADKKYSKYQFFIASYGRYPRCRFTLWQHSEKGKVSGISGNVDVSCFHKDKSVKNLLLK